MSSVYYGKRFYSMEPAQTPPVDDSSGSLAGANKERTNLEKLRSSMPDNTRFVYPEFLPDPNLKFRHPIREKMERQDMLNRRYASQYLNLFLLQ